MVIIIIPMTTKCSTIMECEQFFWIIQNLAQVFYHHNKVAGDLCKMIGQLYGMLTCGLILILHGSSLLVTKEGLYISQTSDTKVRERLLVYF